MAERRRKLNNFNRWGRFTKFSTGPGTSETKYIYGLGRRLLERVDANGSRQRYYYDGLNPVAVRGKAAGTGTPWKVQEIAMLRNTEIAADIMRRTYDYIGVTTYTADRGMHWNQNGHLTHETDQNSMLTNYYETDAFGTVTGSQGTAATQATFRYTGKRYDSASGLYNYGARWLKAADPTWQAAEPLGLDGPNMYHYAFQDPVNNYDSNGLWSAFAPHTWGDATPVGHSPWDLDNPQNTWEGAGQGAAEGAMAFGDGFVPFGDPFEANGFYSSCSPGVAFSKGVGETVRDIELALAGARFGHSIGPEFTIGKIRIAPFGSPRVGIGGNGRLPHYHRPRPHPSKRQARNGHNAPGQSMDRHRPWDTTKYDKSPWDRF